MMKTWLVAAVSLIFSSTVMAQKTDRFQLSDSLLDRVATTLPAVRSAVADVQLENLTLDYSEGKLIEQNKELCVQHIESVKRSLSGARSRGLLLSDVQLLVSLQELSASLDSLAGRLTNPSTLTDREQAKLALRCAIAVVKAATPLNKTIQELKPVVLRAVGRADLLLSACAEPE